MATDISKGVFILQRRCSTLLRYGFPPDRRELPLYFMFRAFIKKLMQILTILIFILTLFGD